MTTDAELRQAALAAWVQRHGGHAEVVRKFGLKPSRASYLSQCINGAIFREKAAENWERDLRMPVGMLKHPSATTALKGNLENRELSTAEDVGMPGKEGDTTTVNPTTDEVKQGSILPLLTWSRVELMLLPNDDPEVRALPTQQIRPNIFEIDPLTDKAVMLEHEVPGTEVKAGFLAVFRPVPKGRRVLQTDLPILVKSPSGFLLLMSYNSLALAPEATEVVAVCIDAYRPRPLGPLWD